MSVAEKSGASFMTWMAVSNLFWPYCITLAIEADSESQSSGSVQDMVFLLIYGVADEL